MSFALAGSLLPKQARYRTALRPAPSGARVLRASMPVGNARKHERSGKIGTNCDTIQSQPKRTMFPIRSRLPRSASSTGQSTRFLPREVRGSSPRRIAKLGEVMMRGRATEAEIIHQIDAESAARTERVRHVLYEAGRPDLVADLDAQLKDLRLGLVQARSCWHSISEAQRRLLVMMERHGGALWQAPCNGNAYYLRVAMNALVRIGRPTVRALAARDLLAWDGGAFTPEAKALLTERARFVVKHGRR